MPEPLEEIQDAVLEKLHAGETPDREGVLAAHPEHAEALRRFFEVLDLIEAPRAGPSPRPSRLGEFQILREVGRGGMGVVYEAEQSSLKRRVALKVLPAGLAGDPRVVARFRREAEAAGRLRHPNVVPVYSVGEEGGIPFFAMELVEGRSVAGVVKLRADGDDAGLPPAGEAWRRWCAETAAKVADALHYAHGRGFLHRDVKPANILLETDGTPRLTDFGLAMELGSPGLTATGETFGTPLYMSPEQAVRREVALGPATDVYSLGVTLYEMLTLHTPYEGTSTLEILTALHQGRIVAPRTADPGMPEPLERILLQALRRAPEERYATAAAFAEDLRSWLASRPVAAEPLRAPKARRLGPVAVLVLALLLVATVLLRPVLWPAPERGRVAGLPVLSPGELALLAEGRGADGEARFSAWLRPAVRLRSVVARSHPGQYECLADGGSMDGNPGEGFGVLILARFEASVDGGPWKPIGTQALTYGAHSVATMPAPRASTALVLGGALAKGSVNLRHRAVCRILPAPKGWMDGIPSARDGHDPLAEASALPGGTSFTWTDERTLFVYDDYPPEYPEVAAGPGVDAAMVASLTPARFSGPNLAEAPGRALGFLLEAFGPPGPVPVAFEVDLLDPATEGVIGTTSLAREARGPGAPAVDTTNYCIGLQFPLPATPSPGEQKFVLDFAAGRIDSVRLRLRPSRKFALEETVFERVWGGSLELSVPSEHAPLGRKTEARILLPAVPTPARSAVGIETVVDPLLKKRIRPRVTLRSRYALQHDRGAGRCFECGMDLEPAGAPAAPGPSEDFLLLTLWEWAAGDRPWKELGFTATTSSAGRQDLQVSVEDLLAAPPAGGTTTVHLRAKVRLLPRPEGWVKHREDLAEAWKLPADAACTWQEDRTVRITEEFPEDYPAVVSSPEVDAAMRRLLAAATVAPDAIHSSDEYAALGMILHLPARGPVPAACEVDLWLDGEPDPVGTGQAVLPPLEPGGLPTTSLMVAFRRPKAEESRIRAAYDRLTSGGLGSVRLVFRPSHRVACEATDFESTWGGTTDVQVPVKGK